MFGDAPADPDPSPCAGGGVAQDMDAAERHAGRSHVPLEPGVERARRDPRCPRTRLPERLRRLHRGEVPAGVRQRDANGLVGRAGQFPAPEMVTLTNILVADSLAFDAEIASAQADHFGAATGGQDEHQEDGSVASARHGVWDDSQ